MNIKKLIAGGLLLSLGILLPQIFHLTGIPNAGALFLPMHIPVLIAGFVLDPFYGLAIGILSPLVSYMATGMPTIEMLPFMVVQLSVYGLATGKIYKSMRFKKLGVYATLIIAMMLGRTVYAFMLVGAAYIFNIGEVGLYSIFTTTFITGIPGMAIQILLIPTLVYALKRGGLLSELERS